ncbi:MAG: mechanosensitive ion channel family protein [Bacteroidales bacterium]|nr:mechanosensitive ion channel family protein [Bacteroidales bacterium]
MISNLKDSIRIWLENAELSDKNVNIIQALILSIIVLTAAILVTFIVRKLLLTLFRRLIRKSETQWDDILIQRKILRKLALLAPAIVIYYLVEYALFNFPEWMAFVRSCTYIYMVLVVMLAALSFVDGLHDILMGFKFAKDKSIKGYIQVLKILVSFAGIIIILSIILGKAPNKLLTGLGALAAVLMLVFKDSILGLVGGIQLSANDMVRLGDWISMPSRNADGDVIDISLNTVKVQNFDKTITTIPTYSMITESFTNWRGMSESDGRRIKRAINIDMQSVTFCDDERINKFRKIHYLKEYIDSKLEELKKFNQANNVDDSVLVNGRRLTNLGTFRRYIEEYLSNHPKINTNMTFLIRQLQPTERGLPIEIYVFSSDKRWIQYEGIQADIFDHIIAVIPEFDLRVFQNPSGMDFQKIVK